jgi:hypothetical protein
MPTSCMRYITMTTMATLFLPTLRKTVELPPGSAISRAISGPELQLALQRGIELQVGSGWKRVSLNYPVQPQDTLRVAGTAGSMPGLVDLVSRLIGGLKRRKRREHPRTGPGHK